jgi:tRNA nucleotidyltransferase/poly(A) polymerase
MTVLAADPDAARAFAAEVVDRLRAAGHETYWAGGCVRDELLGRVPADYDVATAAEPHNVRAVFGQRRTLAVGAAFGVITVLGPRGAGQVEVATFRADRDYTDGRHPAGVTFCSAREDAQRRDFTINGLFLDPRTGEVHDFVGGREDLARGIVRCIGAPAMRFGEDHLRMLRAVRFTAFFGFSLDRETREALERMAHLAGTVSPERIAAELRAMASRAGRGRAFELLEETGLARELLPEVAPTHEPDRHRWREAAAIVGAFDGPDLPMALATVGEQAGDDALPRIVARLRLSNRETNETLWIRAGVTELARGADPMSRPWSHVQSWVAHADAPLLADVLRARAARGRGDPATADWFTAQTARPRAEIDPPPLLSGSDLLAAGLPAGREIGVALQRIRALQLDGAIASREEAVAVALSGPTRQPGG